MGMPASVEIADKGADEQAAGMVFAYWEKMERIFSIFRRNSEIERINRGELEAARASAEVREVLELCEQTWRETDGYFDVRFSGKLDPSGLVKGWAIYRAAEQLRQQGYSNFCAEIGGDAELRGRNGQGEPWAVGVKNPFSGHRIVQKVWLQDRGVATSGTYARGAHIFNPIENRPAEEVLSLTVIGPNVYEADRLATPAFAMGQRGLKWLEEREGVEGLLIDKGGREVFTSGWEKYTLAD